MGAHLLKRAWGSRCPAWFPRVFDQDGTLQGVYLGLRKTGPKSSLHGLQAGSHEENHQSSTLCAEESCLHGDPQCAESGLQTSPGQGLRPGALWPSGLL